MKHLHLFFFFVIFLAGCGPKNAPKGLLLHDKMVDVLTDIHLADGYTAGLTTDSTALVGHMLYQSIFEKYETDSVHFANSLAYYSQNPDLIKPIYQEVSVRIDNLLKIQNKILLTEQNKNAKIEKRRLDSVKRATEVLKKDSLKKMTVKHRLDSLKKIQTLHKRDSVKNRLLKRRK